MSSWFCSVISEWAYLIVLSRYGAISATVQSLASLAHNYLCPEFTLRLVPIGETTMKLSVHEDNSGALVLAKTLPPQFTPRSKYYAIKTIWFREEIHKRCVQLLKIDTVEQLGDIFTKGLVQVTFEYLRKKIIGW